MVTVVTFHQILFVYVMSRTFRKVRWLLSSTGLRRKKCSVFPGFFNLSVVILVKSLIMISDKIYWGEKNSCLGEIIQLYSRGVMGNLQLSEGETLRDESMLVRVRMWHCKQN